MHRGAAPPPSPPLPRQVKLFGWVSLLNDFASEMIYPLLPAFITGVLGGGAQALVALDGAAARRADRRCDTAGAAGARLRPAARHGSRRRRPRADPRLVAARVPERERAGGDRVEHCARRGRAGTGQLGGERQRRSGEAVGGWGG